MLTNGCDSECKREQLHVTNKTTKKKVTNISYKLGVIKKKWYGMPRNTGLTYIY